MLFKSYQILSEDARCDLRFVLQNVSGYDHVACRGYYFLLKEAGAVFNLKDASVWRHLLGLSAAAKTFQIPLKVYLDPKQDLLSVEKLYALFNAAKFGTQISLSTLDGAKDTITEGQEKQALQLLCVELFEQMKECFKEAEVQPQKLVVPYETSIFSYADFYKVFQKVATGYQVIPTNEQLFSQKRDFTSWIQTMDAEATFGCFFFAVNDRAQNRITKESIAKAMPFIPKSLLQDLPFKCQDDMLDVLIDAVNVSFQVPDEQPHELVTVTHSSVQKAFKNFLNMSHTLCTGMFVTPLAAVMDYKFRFQASETVVCVMTGAITTTRTVQDFPNYVAACIYDALNETCEIIEMKVSFDTSDMRLCEELMKIFKENNIVIQHWHYTNGGVLLACQTPGYEALTQVQIAVEKRIGRNAFSCQDMPRNYIASQRPADIDYSAEKAEKKFDYQSDLRNFDDITCESVENAYKRLQSIKATDKTVVVRDANYSAQLHSNIYLVFENIQQTGSFKIRGASNMLIKAHN